ncbi:hypothetical protein HCJ46_16405 [Listeria booriae]|uniref:hypothetical protein n=1 Tax=Listeria booriae TaxID=1552123 RepID=UPI001623C141|nr:hypothetical protein [Listeria booriae]MBC1920342.1 hypothetical protein [Listeria booriae]
MKPNSSKDGNRFKAAKAIFESQDAVDTESQDDSSVKEPKPEKDSSTPIEKEPEKPANKVDEPVVDKKKAKETNSTKSKTVVAAASPYAILAGDSSSVEKTKSWNFTMKPSVRNMISELTKRFGKSSGSALLSEVIEALYDEGDLQRVVDFRNDSHILTNMVVTDSERTSSYNFTLKPSVRKKLAELSKRLNKASDSALVAEMIEVLYKAEL